MEALHLNNPRISASKCGPKDIIEIEVPQYISSPILMDERQQQRILAWIGESYDDEMVDGLENDDDNKECLDEVSDHDRESEQECEDNNHLSERKQIPGVQYEQ
ncbi:hypothetical protein HHI36_022091 [Cryptolaemus montrouzieri]|uniref:Uncharacterized protein n=1 Tax=Cryptolaemus montrouzieri TaxID=559131 RepID=A0ABD2MZK3_9CUCU